jgi:predicted DNA-binding transcriptional regulator AlpA
MRLEKIKTGVRNMPTITETLLTRKQVAAIFQMSKLSVIRLEAGGKLPAIRLGAGSVRYRRSDIEKFLQECSA